ncbi:type VII secretion-associated serine protease mycosin [Mycobacterium intermedium]|uniref:Type VII secretion-associated serine protease mycosin n=1 Tax=Mycobacterium intermedium TaxID=28445 RepID=A0A1E3S8L5_MYCIE|nr:type VII secretion-associated serine protease mycosin [Mycobacterium intermedium]MCV6965010.1 type VII secretion-associated serine protease mycosin [Mycobacterium intermedium]ODQ98450.1 type VII secretion-associated serine protease mycosin [Mycobacterium intermedium]OPE48219.1 type VII secretion-associated serine protease mycosin [Mycobacterium intermedium]ORB06916.1 type VII secretion-associated serine protease mycosin [Mycobacterium intermedium]
MTRRGLACLAATFAAVMWTCPSALAINKPEVDPAVPPPPGAPGPIQPMEQRGACSVTGLIPGTDTSAPTASQAVLNLPAAWQFSRGEGQLVAVIDTGVRPGPRLPNVEPGGDFVETTDGLSDCDGHGTLVAGIIAGQPGDDGFSGVAPAARVLSIRVTSAKFSPRTPGGDPTIARASLDIAALARAIVHAADLGARVINISAITCLPADRPVDQAALGAAIRYAAVEKDVVIVAAAGNSGTTGSAAGGSSCDSNPLTDLSHPDDPRNWAGVTSISIPSWWQPYVLSVASVTPEGQPSKFTMAGPWVGIAAPGEKILSVGNGDGGGLANGLPDDHGQLVTLNGTSYASGYVSGVAALLRSRYPELSATEVVNRLTTTAHDGARAPSNVVGAGHVDAVAALTWELPTNAPDATTVKPVAVPPPPAPKDTTPRNIAFAGAATLALLVAITAATVAITRRRKELLP